MIDGWMDGWMDGLIILLLVYQSPVVNISSISRKTNCSKIYKERIQK